MLEHSQRTTAFEFWKRYFVIPTIRTNVKANLIPARPPFHLRDAKLNRKQNLDEWGKPQQGVSAEVDSVPFSPEEVNEKLHKATIAPSGSKLEEEVRKVAIPLVASAIKAERYKEYTIVPGEPNFHEAHAAASGPEIIKEFLKWYYSFARDPQARYLYRLVQRRFRLAAKGMKLADNTLHLGSMHDPNSALLFKIFMAYIQPDITKDKKYNQPRFELFKLWMKMENLEEITNFATRLGQRRLREGGFMAMKNNAKYQAIEEEVMEEEKFTRAERKKIELLPSSVEKVTVRKTHKEYRIMERESFNIMSRTDLYGILRVLFTDWEYCVGQLEKEKFWGPSEKALAEDIRQRARLFRAAESDPILKAIELSGWTKLLERTLKQKA